MLTLSNAVRFRMRPDGLSLYFAILCFMAALANPATGADLRVLPKEIEEMQFGMSSSQLVDKIKASGEHGLVPHPRRKGAKILTWTPKGNPFYEQIQFQLTEKDRLFVVRFALKGLIGADAKSLRSSFLNRFGISPENPGNMKFRRSHAVIYSAKGKGPYLLDVTDVVSNKRRIEIFHKPISDEDRPKRATASPPSGNQAPNGQESADKKEKSTPEAKGRD
ncbi:hypothetical protein ACFL2Q_11750 [Thermodesulfobacteriota bacterium]